MHGALAGQRIERRNPEAAAAFLLDLREIGCKPL
jgi:hypothetical protein